MNSVTPTLAIRNPGNTVEDAVAAFRIALDQYSDPELRDFAPREDHPAHQEILCELIRTELVHRWNSGTPTPLEYYVERYPELFENAVLQNFRDDRRALFERFEHVGTC